MKKNYDSLHIPKLKALDYYGLSHRETIKLVRGVDLKETVSNFEKLLNKIKNSINIDIIAHNKSRVILFKKKEAIESFSDLRPISVMPALIMAFEKIISTPLKWFIQYATSDQQYAVRARSDVNLAKIDMAIAASKGYNKMLLIDIEKHMILSIWNH